MHLAAGDVSIPSPKEADTGVMHPAPDSFPSPREMIESLSDRVAGLFKWSAGASSAAVTPDAGGGVLPAEAAGREEASEKPR